MKWIVFGWNVESLLDEFSRVVELFNILKSIVRIVPVRDGTKRATLLSDWIMHSFIWLPLKLQENGNGQLSLSSFLPRRASNMPPPSAYATTTLVSSSMGARSHHGAYSLSNGAKSDTGSNCSYSHHDLGLFPQINQC